MQAPSAPRRSSYGVGPGTAERHRLVGEKAMWAGGDLGAIARRADAGRDPLALVRHAGVRHHLNHVVRHSAASSSAAVKASAFVQSPSNRTPLTKKVGVPFTPLRTPLMKLDFTFDS